MSVPTVISSVAAAKSCPQNEIAAYIDGELSPREELELEMHLAICGRCATELNEQKKLLCALDFALEHERKIELPANFTKVVVTTAANRVSGLRRKQERAKAILVCAALFSLVLLGLGGETGSVFGAFWKFGEQFLAVGGFVWRLIYDIAVGTTVILRSISHCLVADTAVPFVLAVGILLVALLSFSHLIVRFKRA